MLKKQKVNGNYHRVSCEPPCGDECFYALIAVTEGAPTAETPPRRYPPG